MGQVRRTAGGRKDGDLRGEFTVVAVPGTHKDQTRRVYGRDSTRRNRLKKADRQKILLEGRRDGLSWREAAKRAGYRSVSGAYQAAQEAIRDIPREAADEARTIELQRLDEVLRMAMPIMRRGDMDAANVVIRAIDRRARMLGLDLAEPDTVRVDVRLQALLMELMAMPAEEFDRHEEEMRALIDASERSADREGRAPGASASGNGVHALR